MLAMLLLSVAARAGGGGGGVFFFMEGFLVWAVAARMVRSYNIYIDILSVGFVIFMLVLEWHGVRKRSFSKAMTCADV